MCTWKIEREHEKRSKFHIHAYAIFASTFCGWWHWLRSTRRWCHSKGCNFNWTKNKRCKLSIIFSVLSPTQRQTIVLFARIRYSLHAIVVGLVTANWYDKNEFRIYQWMKQESLDVFTANWLWFKNNSFRFWKSLSQVKKTPEFILRSGKPEEPK